MSPTKAKVSVFAGLATANYSPKQKDPDRIVR